jgi:hypothetical protein
MWVLLCYWKTERLSSGEIKKMRPTLQEYALSVPPSSPLGLNILISPS